MWNSGMRNKNKTTPPPPPPPQNQQKAVSLTDKLTDDKVLGKILKNLFHISISTSQRLKFESAIFQEIKVIMRMTKNTFGLEPIFSKLVSSCQL